MTNTLRATIILLCAILLSCAKEKCVMCIAESDSGNIIKMHSACNKKESYLNGFIQGIEDYYQDYGGDTTHVHCTKF